MVFCWSVPMMMSTLTEQSSLEVAFMKYFDMEFLVPDKEPLFN